MPIAGTSTIHTTRVSQSAIAVCPDNGNRIGLMISVSNDENPADMTASAWIKFSTAENAGDEKTGFLIRASSPFPFCMMPDTIYYGEVSAVSGTLNDVTVHITEY